VEDNQDIIAQLVKALTKQSNQNHTGLPDAYRGAQSFESPPEPAKGFFARLADPHVFLKDDHAYQVVQLVLQTHLKSAQLDAEDYLDTKRRDKESKARMDANKIALHEAVAGMEAEGWAEILKHRTLKNLVDYVAELRLDPLQESLLIKTLIGIFTRADKESSNGTK
jgi:hypothetical protein